MRRSHMFVRLFALLCFVCPQMAFCVMFTYLPYVTLHDIVDFHFPIMSLAFGGRGYIVRTRKTDVGLRIEFDSTLGFPGEGPKTNRNLKRKLPFIQINVDAKAEVVTQQVQKCRQVRCTHTHAQTYTRTLICRLKRSSTYTFSKDVCNRNEGVETVQWS